MYDDGETSMDNGGENAITRGMEIGRRAAVGLLLLTGLTHMSQLLVYQWADDVIAAAIFGAIYFAIGLALLLRPGRATLWLAVAVPIVGAALGISRALGYPNAFSLPHVAIDLIEAPIAIGVLRRWPYAASS